MSFITTEALQFRYAVTGPWTIHEPGVLHVRDTAMFRPQPDPPETLADFYTHIASPEIVVDEERREIHLLFHGWWTSGERWPADPAAARQWATANRYAQMSQAAVSSDGLTFTVRPSIIPATYLRVIKRGGKYLAMSRLGALSRSATPYGPFEMGPNPFADGRYARRVRHVAVVQRGDTLYVFFTAIGDVPERVMLATIDMRGDWAMWRASPPMLVVQPEEPYECADLPLAPSESGDVDVPVRQIRDPFVFEDLGRAYLFYATCGEQGIAGAELTF